MAWEEEEEELAVVWGRAVQSLLSCTGGTAVGRPGALEFSLWVRCFAPLSPPAIPIFLSQWEASRYVNTECGEGCRCCCTGFWGGSSRRWVAGKMYRRRRGGRQELLRQQKVKLQQHINFLLSTHAPRRFLPHKRGSCAWRVHLLWYLAWLPPRPEPGLRLLRSSHSC